MCRFQADVIAEESPDPATCGRLSSQLTKRVTQVTTRHGVASPVCGIRPSEQPDAVVTLMVDARLTEQSIVRTVKGFVRDAFGPEAQMRPLAG